MKPIAGKATGLMGVVVSKKSIGRDLFRSIAISITVLWFLVVTSVALFSNRETEEIFDNSLQETAQRLLSLAVHEVIKNKAHETTWGEPLPHGEYVTYQVFDRAANLLIRSHQAPQEPYPVPLKKGFYKQENQVFYVESTRDEAFHIVLAENPFHRQHTLFGLMLSLIIPLGLLLPLSYWLVHHAIKRAKSPLHEFSQAVALRDGKNLTPLAIENVPSEIEGLGYSVNFLLNRLESVLSAEKNFMANMAHELKTPLAIALAQIDVALNQTHRKENIARLQRARNAVLRVEQTSAKLLQLVRAESGRALDVCEIDLKSLLDILLSDLFSVSHQQCQLEMPYQAVWIQGDLDAVGICVLNLLENALRYSTPASCIHVVLANNGQLEIENDCPAIPADQLEKITLRHVRCSSHATGCGLGLAIVTAILDQMGGSLVITSPSRSDSRGFKVVVRFAADSQN